MPASVTYSVSTTGGVLDGFTTESVITSFSSVFGVKHEKASAYIESEKLIKKDLTQAEAEAYRDRLVQIGLPIALVEHVSEKPDDAFGGMSLLPADEPSANNSVQSGSPSASSKNTGFQCPKCQAKQVKSKQCSACGVIFEKYHAAKAAEQSVGSSQPSLTKTDAKHNRLHEGDDDGNVILILGVAMLVAAFAAFLWKFIAVSVGWELGVIAWAIGGAVGAAAAMVGSRGDTQGVICAALVVLAIAGGKYMVAGALLEQANEMFTSADSEMMTMLDELQTDAEAFASIGSSPQAVKTFMVDYGYSDAVYSSDVSAEELSDFQSYNAPMLAEFQTSFEEADSDAEGMAAMFGSVLGNVTQKDMFLSMWGMLDILFLILGASTAYRLASAGRD